MHVVVVIHKKICYSQIVRSSDSDPRLQRTESPLKTRRDVLSTLEMLVSLVPTIYFETLGIVAEPHVHVFLQ